jgi:hypothetical protein
MIPLHGVVGLQSKVTASGVADVPLMFLYVTPLIFTPELYIYIYIYIYILTKININYRISNYRIYIKDNKINRG